MTATAEDRRADIVVLEVPSRRSLAWALGTVGATLVGLGVVASVLERSDAAFAGREHVITLLSLKSEYNVPTVISALWLAAAALLLLLLAAVQRARGAPFVTRWALLSAIFLYLAIDEGARLHERLNEPLAALPITTGVLRWGWVLVGGLVVVALLVGYLRFVLELPPPFRARVVVAAALYVGGALLMELVGAGTSQGQGLDTPRYLALTIVEESLELSGIGLFIVTLWGLLRRWAGQLVLRHPPH